MDTQVKNNIWSRLTTESSPVEILAQIMLHILARLLPTPPETSSTLSPKQLELLETQVEAIVNTPVESRKLKEVYIPPEARSHTTTALQLIGVVVEANLGLVNSFEVGTGNVLTHLPCYPSADDLPISTYHPPPHNLLPPATVESNVWHADALNELTPAAEYDIVIANPPFKIPLGGYDRIAPHLLDVVKTKSSELLFIIQALQSLKPGGRAAIIVPCGVLFRRQAHLKLRRILIEQHKLEAVVSIPAGAFKPRTGVPTALLVFSKTSDGTEQIWMYDMQADGFSLDNKRRQLPSGHENNNIPDILARWRNLEQEQNRARTEQSFCVPIAEIIDQDYQLRFPLYQEFVPEPVPDVQQCLIELREAETATRKAMRDMYKMLAELGYSVPEIEE